MLFFPIRKVTCMRPLKNVCQGLFKGTQNGQLPVITMCGKYGQMTDYLKLCHSVPVDFVQPQ